MDIDTQFTQAMTEQQPNSSNSTHELDEQHLPPDQLEAYHNTFIPNVSLGSNPSGEPGGNPSQRVEEPFE